MARAYNEPFLYRVRSDADIYAYCRANDIDQLTGIVDARTWGYFGQSWARR